MIDYKELERIVEEALSNANQVRDKGDYYKLVYLQGMIEGKFYLTYHIAKGDEVLVYYLMNSAQINDNYVRTACIKYFIAHTFFNGLFAINPPIAKPLVDYPILKQLTDINNEDVL